MEKFIELGKKFALEGAELLAFVENHREEEREEKRREEEREEKGREEEREEKRREEEREEKRRREEDEKEERLRIAEEEKVERRRRQDDEREARRQEREIRKLQMEAEMKRIELEQTHQGPGAQASNKEDRAKAPKLPSFVDGKGDLDAYLQRFERFATTAKWDKAGWATKLSALLLSATCLLPPFRRSSLRLWQDEDSSYEKV